MTARLGVRRFTVTETREVMEVRADNLEEVAAWCGGVAEDGGVTVMSHIDGQGTIQVVCVGPGDVLVTDGHRWWDVPREEFERDLLPRWTEETT